ncbi:hypothetical protein DM02DRAFT_664201 [Periconia macrospinosa]|uniref:Uncharacterized protein n=1 Tax=Periconia macrospinosa TaxID=97972 RepID=A0A2V1CZM8_9PLEO|nr:hypothetical protein DM02DRAFT_664201 [Periconia macrospinosa]
MAARLGTIVPQDAMKLIDEIEKEDQHIDRFISRYPIDLMKAAESDNARSPEGWKEDSVKLFTTLHDDDDGDANKPR